VQRAARVVDAQAVAQRIQAVALAGVHLLGHAQRVGHAAHEAGERGLAEQLQFLVQEADVERGVVDDDFGARR
jgi:hypothetical protein